MMNLALFFLLFIIIIYIFSHIFVTTHICTAHEDQCGVWQEISQGKIWICMISGKIKCVNTGYPKYVKSSLGEYWPISHFPDSCFNCRASKLLIWPRDSWNKRFFVEIWYGGSKVRKRAPWTRKSSQHSVCSYVFSLMKSWINSFLGQFQTEIPHVLNQGEIRANS